MVITAKRTISRISDMMSVTALRPIACISMWPRPAREPNISLSNVPISVSEKPTRRPVKISGSAAGTMTVVMVCHCERPSVRATFSSTGLMVATAFTVKIVTGTMPWMTANATSAAMPMPKNNRMTG